MNANVITIDDQNLCATDADNIEIKAPDLNNDYASKAIKCKNWVTNDTGMSSVDNTVDYTNVNPTASNNHSWVEHPLDVYNIVACPPWSNNDKIDGSATTTNATGRECALYHSFSATEFGCIKCPWGKVGSSTTYAVPKTGESTLGSCETLNTCESNTKYKNINPYWNQFFSCHKCSSSVSIPVLIPKTADVDTLAV